MDYGRVGRIKRTVASLCTFAIVFVSATCAYAIPAFTRAHKVECSTCHTVFPELNEYGEAFLKNGYVYVGKGKKKIESEDAVKAPVTAGEKPAADSVPASNIQGVGDAGLLDKLKAASLRSTEAPASASSPVPAALDERTAMTNQKSLSEGIALSGVPEQLPISFTANLQGTYNRDAVNEFDFSTRSLKLAAGGNIKEKAGFFGTYLLYTENVDKSANTSTIPTNMTGKTDIGELFFIWRHALDTGINLKVGRFQPKLGLWKSNNKVSIAHPYAAYSYTVGQSLFTADQAQDALEANMILANRLFIAGGAVNRKNQNTKEWYAHVSAKVGGADFLANEPEIDLDKEESVFDFLSLTVGGYWYAGTNGDPNTGVVVPLRQNKFYRAGVDLDLLYKLFRLKMSGIVGEDDNPELNYSEPTQKSTAATVELQYTVLKELIGSLRFEYLDVYSDGSTRITRRIIPTCAYTPIENLKITAEYMHEYGDVYDTAGKRDVSNNVGTLGVTFSF
ncbi:MAG: hypothetical protein PHY09_13365 [Desulfuromonadaceae bacterium]|nr:hypothetical protein [Desulfuromonadaceae bacterium]MDD5107375.1 hypothetical protein [Desulfuromonadaceae bacterium]